MQKIENKKINEIKPYSKNAKKHPISQIKKIAQSIQEFGFNQPIVIDSKNIIIVGHGRYEASKLLKLEEVPILQIDLSEQQAKAYRLADNKLNESKWDMDLVIEELKELAGEMVDLTGFDKNLILEVQEFETPEPPKSPNTKTGEIFQLGDHRLMCGDSANAEDVKKIMDNQKAQLIFTDPPYNVDYKSPGGLSYNSKKFGGTGGKIFNDNKTDAECLKFYTDVLKNIYLFSKDDATIYWWFANKNNHINRQAFENANWKMSQIIIWVKNSMVFSHGQDYHRQYEPCMLGWKKGKSHFRNKQIVNLKDVINLDFDDFKTMFNVWYEKRDLTTEYVHPTQKPVRLAERALKRHSKQDDIVLDLFGGSGSTLICCEQMNRKCFVMEMDPKYCDVIIKRWEDFTNQKAKKIN
jgi:DNA modification methylase